MKTAEKVKVVFVEIQRELKGKVSRKKVALLLDFVLTKHKKLNLEQQPSEEDPDYSFSHCARESLSQKVTK